MTMNDRTKNLIEQLTDIRTRTPERFEISDDTMNTLVTLIRASAVALDVPLERIPHMLDLAFDNMPPQYEMPNHDALMYALMLNIFALYYVSESSFDELMTHFSDS